MTEDTFIISRRRDDLWFLPWFLRPYEAVEAVVGEKAFNEWCRTNSWVGIQTTRVRNKT